MNEFEEFSGDINRVAEQHSKYYGIYKVMCRIECWIREKNNAPLPFKRVGDGEGEKVGDPIKIDHLTTHDMMGHQARHTLTEKVFLEGVKINAFSVLDFVRLGKHIGISTIQPLWVEP